MEIEQLRQEINELLESLVEHCDRYTGKRHLTSLEVNHVIAKTNNLQEQLSVLKYLLEQPYNIKKTTKTIAPPQEEKKLPIVETVQNQEPASTPIHDEVMIPLPIETPLTETKKTEEPSILSESVAAQIQQASITKLVDAFNLNDRYLYANELFNKDMSAFNELIKALDNSSSLESAQTLFNQTGVTNSWDVENQLVIDFMTLIERRFI